MKKIIIIGAGIAGLSAGIYARRNDYDVTIYESHFLPGGMCTSWQRRGFTFEGCMHFLGLMGTSPAHVNYRQWQELGVVPHLKMIHHDIFHTFRDKSGRTLNLYTDADKLEKELLALSPPDEKEIRALCSAIKQYTWFIRTTGGNPFRLIARAVGILGAIPLIRKYGAMNIGEYMNRFKDPLIRYAFSYLFVYPDFSSLSLFFALAGMHIRGIGYPQGSSLVFAKTMEQTFLGLNGKIVYRKKVRRITVADNRTTGIELEDGSVVRGDIIISAADGHATLFDMLEDKFTTPDQRERYATQPVFLPFIQVSLGINRDMSGTPHAVKCRIEAPFELAGQNRQELVYYHTAFDPTLAPQGKSSVIVLYPSDLAWWEKIGYDNEAYKDEKKRILEVTIAQLEKVLPGITPQIEVSDVATPFTTVRYTHNWKGALGFLLTKTMAAEMYGNPRYTLPGLAGFYMAGQWVKGFGVPVAAAGGRDVIRKICRLDGRKFRAG